MENARHCRWCNFVNRLLFFFLLPITFSSAKSQTYENLQVSLLTVEPRSKAVWTIFGHTALRLYDPDNIDAVLNWGTFDWEKPNFILRYIKGETDYFLSESPFRYFILHYSYDGAAVTEQILNIPDDEKGALLKFIQNNLQPENSEYRYNFIFDNCTTRPRDIIERFCGGSMIYAEQTQAVTFRRLIHQNTKPYPWLEFGIDCVIGSGADSLITYRDELFLPERLMQALNHAVIKSAAGEEQPIVLTSKLLLSSPDSQPARLAFWERPLLIGLLILALYFTFVIVDYLKKYRFRLPYALLFFVAGTGGCVVVLLNFFSLHPCVQSNWNLLWLHPLHFIACIGFFFRKSYCVIRWYHAVNFVLLSSFLLGWFWIPQELNKAFIPFVVCLWIVSGLQAVVLKQRKYE